MTTIHTIYNQVTEMLALLEPKKILALRASSEVQKRFELLVEKSKNEEISPIEKDELNHFLVLDRLFRLAKIKADMASKKL